jgi:hypothetical protein
MIASAIGMCISKEVQGRVALRYAPVVNGKLNVNESIISAHLCTQVYSRSTAHIRSFLESNQLADIQLTRFRGDTQDRLRALRGAGDDHDQRLPREKRNVTYVTRLQAVQAAVSDQLETMQKEHPASR